ncbi:methyltransferase domain-containing protein [Microbulbifer flavimaris]|uniref:Methyltransferase domain-containing protein n=1 Tax=Microbulbifer flavimaris TaxID=1781068 RepID=A0ABX4HWJ9_9GAMM|nr:MULTISPECIES: methyltransferase domain-containing protein [Microbulbifer]KUJ81538.1 23S rRNA methyltransferase [Microbulbifer sp. ZGT114]PCO04441.1 methyltransferase domain-containing protein [Microbulbifer flavimaris]
MIWHCPICRLPLECRDESWHCGNGHLFDRAREGYVNLLPVQRKHSKEPGDSADMLRARRHFLEAGHYRPLVEAIAALLPFESGRQLLDVGCGEGYYTRQLCAAGWPADALAGVDIAKAGVRMAAKSQPGSQYVVAGNFDLPVAEDSVDHILRVFAPGDAEELSRVVNPGGSIVDVAPGPEHLWSLKGALYREPRRHEPPKPLQGFVPEVELRCCFLFTLDGPEAITDFLSMTPFAWKGDPQARAELEQRERLRLEADFVVRRMVCRK